MAYIGNTQQNQNYVPAIDYFSGNGSTTAFTLSRPVASVAQVQAVIENVPQNPGDAYTVSGNTITFTSAPPSGTNNIYIYYTSPNTQVTALPQSPVVYGNLNFGSTGARIQGDFSTATLANRVMFQTSTTNGATNVYAIPNGTGTTAGYTLANNSDPSNAGITQVVALSTESSLRAAITGTGSYLPMTFYTGGTERMRIDTSGNVSVGVQTANARLELAKTSGVAFRLNDLSTNYWELRNDSNLIFDRGGTERMRITSSGGVSFGASGTNYGAAGQTLISAGNAAPEWQTYNSVYATPQTGDTAKWVYLGRWSNAAQDGRKLEMYINSSAGYNADIGQNQESYLFFKTSNDSSFQAGSSGNFFADGYVRVYSSNQNVSPSSIRVVQIDKNTYDFYGFFNTYTGGGSFYRVTAGPGTSWTNSSTIVGTTWTVSGNFVALPMMFTYYNVSTGQATPPPYYSARAWVNFNGTGTVAIRASGNVSSITDGGVGIYTINFTTAMPDVNYNAVGASARASNDYGYGIRLMTFATGSLGINTITNNAATLVDYETVCVSIFR